jgi:hypothetical protein
MDQLALCQRGFFFDSAGNKYHVICRKIEEQALHLYEYVLCFVDIRASKKRF